MTQLFPTWGKRLSGRARQLASCFFLLTGLLLAPMAQALQGANGSHDPSNIIKEGNKYWMFTTGVGIYAAYSTDLINWTSAPAPVFSSKPAWIATAVPGFVDTYWAPECIFMNNKYYLYYSCSTFGSPRSAIGVATSPTLDPAAPNYGWTDLGQAVVTSTTSSNVNAIDPAIFKDSDGRVYMHYGSFNGGLGVVELNPTTGGKLNSTAVLRVAGNTTSGTRDWEAPYLVKENGFYYYYANRGLCCNGKSSTYRIVVGRGTSPMGPFLDKNGVALTATNAQATTQAGVNSVGTLVLGTSGRYIGPGHFGLLRDGGVNIVSMHYYDGTTANGDAKLDLAQLKYDVNNWPIISRNWLPAGRYKITNRNSGLVWDSWGCTANAGEMIAQGPWNGAQCQRWDLVPVGDGFYKVANALNGNRVADLAFCNNANGTTIGIWDWLNNDCQKMKLERSADGSFTFSPAAASNRIIEVPAASLTAGVQLAIWEYTGSLCQKWTVAAAPNTWTGASSTAWATAGNWSQGIVPAANESVIIPAGRTRYPAIGTGTTTVADLTIETGGRLSIAGGQLSVTGTFTNNGTLTSTGGTVAFTGSELQSLGGSQTSTFMDLSVGSNGLSLGGPAAVAGALSLTGSLRTNGQDLTLLSNAAGTALVVNSGGVVNGRATMQRYIDPSLNAGSGYRHYASPMSNGLLADLTTTGYAPVFNTNYNTSATPNLITPYPTVFGYYEVLLGTSPATALNSFDKGFFSPGSGDPMDNGRGYTVNIPATAVVNFRGTLANGNVTIGNLTRGPQAEAGWHLLGNPYPAPIDWSTLTAASFTNMEPALYVFQSTGQYSGGYRSYVNGVGISPLVAAGQGFFVRKSTAAGNGALAFTNANRVTSRTSQVAFNRGAADSRPLVALALRGAGHEDVAHVYFENGATAGFDTGFDAEKLANPSGLNLTWPVAGGQELAINGLPTLTASTVVPLTINLPQAGSYTLSAEQLLNLGGTAVYLLDAATGQTIDLHQQPAYTFTAATTALAGRFSLRFEAGRPTATAAQLAAELLTVYPNPASGSMRVTFDQQLPTECTLLNVLGQAVAVPQQRDAAGTTLDVRGVAAGTYVLRVGTAGGSVSRRVVIQ
ncbi:family 43 glycosylhydrolase [Hymenobacter sp. ASUV-10]|uniref:Family 43 glycosylhydrolase n=1 Tax=Hymenobacter aranciens TaxID=3063996 RepID=A0ABT9B4X6_9BACT|nr:family 43 glycosylhydrolase [Hymenobacter sp. ASUV-10]MDO7873315.1 family 43 glycosylhydrolase [Hymenobacter sp. ASUV-10]